MSCPILIERFRGDTYPISINCTKGGQPFNIKGYTMKMSVTAEEDPVAPATYLFQSDAIIDSSVDGKAHFPVLEVDVDRIGTVHFDIEVIDGAGYKRTPIKGAIEFKQDITK
jgi:hypothetical protein